MNKNKIDTVDLRNKILKGLDLAVEKLIRRKQKEDGELVFSRNGEVVIVKAKDLSAE
ncbi:hypothetical protein I0P70_20835 [Pontibacter sp. FD36]|uniref:hypothetical protein n=1 Tax=Pontibacter sp. FD36 TaxID=2789860 RepID=UPI0018AC3819|nr:hypothetical protein [Pontibacter sp. FD36]MBF8965711.1 hypothetical protein [Pontibacter sp. FD36]